MTACWCHGMSAIFSYASKIPFSSPKVWSNSGPVPCIFFKNVTSLLTVQSKSSTPTTAAPLTSLLDTSCVKPHISPSENAQLNRITYASLRRPAKWNTVQHIVLNEITMCTTSACGINPPHYRIAVTIFIQRCDVDLVFRRFQVSQFICHQLTICDFCDTWHLYKPLVYWLYSNSSAEQGRTETTAFTN